MINVKRPPSWQGSAPVFRRQYIKRLLEHRLILENRSTQSQQEAPAGEQVISVLSYLNLERHLRQALAAENYCFVTFQRASEWRNLQELRLFSLPGGGGELKYM